MTCDNNNHLTIHPGSRLWSYGTHLSPDRPVMNNLLLSCVGREDVKISISTADLVQLVHDLVEANLIKAKTVFE